MPHRFVQKLLSFAPLEEAEIIAIRTATKNVRKVPARTDLIREGDRPGSVIVMIEGWAFRYKILPNGARQVIAFLMPGDACDLHVGTLAEMDHGIRTATAAKVATIEPADMSRIMTQHPGITRAMYAALLADEGISRAWIVSMGRRNSLERVAHLICELYVRANSLNTTSNTSVDIPLAQSLLADALGMTTVHINRVLNQLKQAGALNLNRGNILVVDYPKLARVAGFNDGYLRQKVRHGRLESSLG